MIIVTGIESPAQGARPGRPPTGTDVIPADLVGGFAGFLRALDGKDGTDDSAEGADLPDPEAVLRETGAADGRTASPVPPQDRPANRAIAEGVGSDGAAVAVREAGPAVGPLSGPSVRSRGAGLLPDRPAPSVAGRGAAVESEAVVTNPAASSPLPPVSEDRQPPSPPPQDGRTTMAAVFSPESDHRPPMSATRPPATGQAHRVITASAVAAGHIPPAATLSFGTARSPERPAAAGATDLPCEAAGPDPLTAVRSGAALIPPAVAPSANARSAAPRQPTATPPEAPGLAGRPAPTIEGDPPDAVPPVGPSAVRGQAIAAAPGSARPAVDGTCDDPAGTVARVGLPDQPPGGPRTGDRSPGLAAGATPLSSAPMLALAGSSRSATLPLAPDPSDGDQPDLAEAAAVLPGLDGLRAAGPPSMPAAPPGAPTSSPAPAVQIVQAVAAGGEALTEITLSPEELGRVRIGLTMQDGSITVTILADRPETADLMRRHLDQLGQEFRAIGFHDVTFSFGTDRGAGRPPPESTAAPPESGGDPVEPALPPAASTATGTGQLDLRL